MLQKNELVDLFDHLKLSPIGRKKVMEVRNSPPARRIGGGRKNVCLRFPSQKMGQTVQAESRHVEYPFVLQCEFDEAVLEYWDQPASLKLAYEDANGRRRAHLHTPDFLVIGAKSIDFVECKTDLELEKIEAKAPGRYHRNENGQWISPAGEEAASKFGLGYLVYTPERTTTTFARNAEFMLDYQDPEIDALYESHRESIQSSMERLKSVSIEDLAEHVGSVDAVHWAVARGIVWFDLDGCLMCYPDMAHVHLSAVYGKAFERLRELERPRTAVTINLDSGQQLTWDDEPWTIVNAVAGQAYLRNKKEMLINLTFREIHQLIEDGTMEASTESKTPDDDVFATLRAASDADLQAATERRAVLNSVEQGLPIPKINGKEPSPRTIRSWQKKFSDAEVAYSNGFIGLLPRVAKRGNRECRLSEVQTKILIESIKEDFATATHRNKRGGYLAYKARCEVQAEEPASYRTYLNWIKKEDQNKLLAAREGAKAAYQLSGPMSANQDWLPPHGDRVFEVGHIDHTELEIDLNSGITSECLGRPWLTTLVDAYSRKPLAHFLTFESPSVRSIMMVLRRCVAEHNRLPQKIVVDQGAEFNSVYFEALLASCQVTKIERPASKARYGSPIERHFGISQSVFIHNLVGNTQNLSLRRSKSPSHDPRKLAVWTMDAFDNRLSQWLYDEYPVLRSHGTHETPEDRFRNSLRKVGNREFRYIKYDQSFILLTLPHVDRGGRKFRVGRGVALNGLSYWSAEAGAMVKVAKKVPVKFDPYDVSYVCAYIEGAWHKLTCSHYLMREYTERELKMAHQELLVRAKTTRQKYRAGEASLINFLSSLRSDEKDLLIRKQQAHLDQAQIDIVRIKDSEDGRRSRLDLRDLAPFAVSGE